MYWIRLDPRCARPFRRKGYSGGIKAKPKRRRRQRVAIPEDLRQDVTQIAQSIARKYRHAFEADCELKTCILTLMSALLPPFPIGPGRPGNPMVTLALKLRAEFRRQFPEETWSQICQRVYVAVIPGYTNLPPMEQRDARRRLLERMTWRRRKRYPRKNRAEFAVS